MESDIGDSDSNAEIDHQTKTWETEPLSLALNGDAPVADQGKCGIGHRVVANRSVLALVLDSECVFAGLQGGDILVSSSSYSMCYPRADKFGRHGPSKRMIWSSQFMLTRKVSWVFIFLRMALCYFRVVATLWST